MLSRFIDFPVPPEASWSFGTFDIGWRSGDPSVTKPAAYVGVSTFWNIQNVADAAAFYEKAQLPPAYALAGISPFQSDSFNGQLTVNGATANLSIQPGTGSPPFISIGETIDN